METKEQLLKQHAELARLSEKSHQRVMELSPMREFRPGQPVQVSTKYQFAKYCSAIEAEIEILSRMREIADEIAKLQK